MTVQDLKDNMSTFSIQQMLSNTDGKTSRTGTIGVYLCLVGSVCFIFGCVDKAWLSGTTDIMMYSTGVITLGSGLLTANKLSKGSSMTDEAVKLSDMNKGTGAPDPV